MPISPPQPLGWYGLYLLAPPGWNLSHFEGKAGRGIVAFSDLRELKLEVRWHAVPANRVTRTFEKMAARAKAKGATVTAITASLPCRRIRHGGATSLLAAGGKRIYEITWPGEKASYFDEIASSLKDHSADAEWPWHVYAARACVPANWVVKQTSLSPGRVELTFTKGRGKIKTGAWSMADRLLNGQSLQAWAGRGVAFIKSQGDGLKAGAWRAGSAEGVAVFEVPGQTWFTRRQALYLWHDRSTNCILWLHLMGGTRAWPVLEQAASKFLKAALNG